MFNASTLVACAPARLRACAQMREITQVLEINHVARALLFSCSEREFGMYKQIVFSLAVLCLFSSARADDDVSVRTVGGEITAAHNVANGASAQTTGANLAIHGARLREGGMIDGRVVVSGSVGRGQSENGTDKGPAIGGSLDVAVNAGGKLSPSSICAPYIAAGARFNAQRMGQIDEAPVIAQTDLSANLAGGLGCSTKLGMLVVAPKVAMGSNSPLGSYGAYGLRAMLLIRNTLVAEFEYDEKTGIYHDSYGNRGKATEVGGGLKYVFPQSNVWAGFDVKVSDVQTLEKDQTLLAPASYDRQTPVLVTGKLGVAF